MTTNTATTRTPLAELELFADLSKSELRSLVRLMTPVRVRAGRDLTREGETGREFMIIVDGTATVRRGGKVIATLGAGDFVGELSMLAGVPRTATVTAEVWMRPWASVSGTRCTRWTPPSRFNRP
mgnify:CR=1 FL=1